MNTDLSDSKALEITLRLTVPYLKLLIHASNSYHRASQGKFLRLKK